MLAPSFDSRPLPFEARRAISCASAKRFDTSIRPRSLSHQRNAGMKSLRPWRIPACDAEVCSAATRPAVEMHLLRAFDPARDRRHAAGPDLVEQDRMGQPVDLDDQHARAVGPDHVAPAGRERPDERAPVRLVLVDREDRGQRGVEHRPTSR